MAKKPNSVARGKSLSPAERSKRLKMLALAIKDLPLDPFRQMFYDWLDKRRDDAHAGIARVAARQSGAKEPDTRDAVLALVNDVDEEVSDYRTFANSPRGDRVIRFHLFKMAAPLLLRELDEWPAPRQPDREQERRLMDKVLSNLESEIRIKAAENKAQSQNRLDRICEDLSANHAKLLRFLWPRTHATTFDKLKLSKAFRDDDPSNETIAKALDRLQSKLLELGENKLVIEVSTAKRTVKLTGQN